MGLQSFMSVGGVVMRGSRLSAIIFLIVIAAMGAALVLQEQRHRQREAGLTTQHEADLAARLER
jgi:hypothetical protein